jgi:hypothetical protein
MVDGALWTGFSGVAVEGGVEGEFEGEFADSKGLHGVGAVSVFVSDGEFSRGEEMDAGALCTGPACASAFAVVSVFDDSNGLYGVGAVSVSAPDGPFSRGEVMLAGALCTAFPSPFPPAPVPLDSKGL